jgi:hypothetical protein
VAALVEQEHHDISFLATEQEQQDLELHVREQKREKEDYFAHMA